MISIMNIPIMKLRSTHLGIKNNKLKKHKNNSNHLINKPQKNN